MKNKILIITTLLLIGVAFWVLNYLTPELNEDYQYKFICNPDALEVDVTTHVTSFYDVMVSQYNHYFNFNGRALVHILVQMFSGIWGKTLFNIINSIVFVFFIYVINLLYSKVRIPNLIFCCFIILLLYPVFNQTALWMTGSINYMWSSAFVCLFLWIIECLNKKTLTNVHWLGSIPCFIIGWTHEGIVFPLAISLFIYVLINRKTIHKRAIFPLIIGFLIGALLCSLSPSTIGRASKNDGMSISGIIQKITTGIFLCLKLKAFITLLCTTIIFYIINKRNLPFFVWLKGFYCKNIIILNALFLSFGFVFLSGFSTTRAAIGVELFSIVILLRLILLFNKTVLYYLYIVIFMIGGIGYGIILNYSIQNYHKYTQMLSQLKNKESNIIVIDEVSLPTCVSSYVVRPLDSSNNDWYSWFCYNSYWNRYIAATFQRDSVVFVTTMVYNDIINHRDTLNNIQQQKDYPFYVVPITDTIDDINPTFILTPTDFQQLPFYIRPFAHKMQRYTATEISATRYSIININKNDYLFIGKNTMIDNRVKAISLK